MRTVAALAIMTVLCFAGALQAQTTNASVTGRVTDPTKATIPGAQVTLINMGTNLHYQGMTNETGTYYVTQLPPGTYRIEVDKRGFKTVVKPGIILHVQDVLEINFEMALGSVSELVTVRAGTPTVQLVTSTISGVVNSTTVRELPLNGRDWTQLATLQPGVVAIRTQASSNVSGNRGNRGFGNQLAVNGHRPYENNYRVNGISTNDYSNGSPGSVLGVQLGVDAIQEFSVLTSNYSAEYGRTSGGIINAITKSGTNAFHGDAYEFLRNNSLDARNFFDINTPPLHRNQFGASAGGPIKKDKTFIFGDYEGVRQGESLSFHDRVPTAAARAGNLCAVPTTGTCTPSTITVSPLVAPYLNFYPLPNSGLTPAGNGDIGFFNGAGLARLSENYETVRVDHTISDSDNLAVSWFLDESSLPQPDPLLIAIHEVVANRQMASAEENHIFSPELSNTVRIAYSRSQGVVGQPVSAINPLAADLSLGAIPGQNAPILAVPGLQQTESLGSPGFVHQVQNSYQAYDDAFLARGTHSLKFGFAVEHLQYNLLHESNRAGSFAFPSLEGFLLDQPTSISALIPGTTKPVGIRQTLFGGYVQDDWRARPNLTLNIGLRYEPVTLPTEAHGQFGVMQNIFSGAVTVPVPSLWKTNQTLRNFAPRAGFSWDPFRNGKTAVRGGFGIFDVLPLPWEYTFTTGSSFPFAEKGNAGKLSPGSFPTGAVQSIAFNPSKFVERYVEQNPHRNYAINWNFNIQRAISPSWAVMVGYVGSHTVHQTFETSDGNMVLPTLTSAGYLWPCNQAVAGFPVNPCTGGGVRLNPSVGAIDGTFWDNSSTYEGLQAQVTKQMSHGFQFQGSYTWGKCIDSGSSGPVPDPFVTSITSLVWFDPQARRGLCDFDVRHTFVANYIWQLPTPKFGGAVAAHILGGWELGGVITASTGSPTTLVIAGDPLGQNSSDTLNFPDRLTGSGCSNPVNPGNVNNYFKLNCFSVPIAPASFAEACQPGFTGQKDSNGNPIPIPDSCMNLFGNAGRNAVIGPGLLNFDFSLFKNIPITRVSESLNIQFRAEFFNIFNRPNFQVPNFGDGNDIVFNQNGTAAGGAGAIDATSTTSRQIQFGLKIIW